MNLTYLVEVERFQDDATVGWARGVRARANNFTGTNFGPLIDEQCFVAVSKPR